MNLRKRILLITLVAFACTTQTHAAAEETKQDTGLVARATDIAITIGKGLLAAGLEALESAINSASQRATSSPWSNVCFKHICTVEMANSVLDPVSKQPIGPEVVFCQQSIITALRDTGRFDEKKAAFWNNIIRLADNKGYAAFVFLQKVADSEPNNGRYSQDVIGEACYTIGVIGIIKNKMMHSLPQKGYLKPTGHGTVYLERGARFGNIDAMLSLCGYQKLIPLEERSRLQSKPDYQFCKSLAQSTLVKKYPDPLSAPVRFLAIRIDAIVNNRGEETDADIALLYKKALEKGCSRAYEQLSNWTKHNEEVKEWFDNLETNEGLANVSPREKYELLQSRGKTPRAVRRRRRNRAV